MVVVYRTRLAAVFIAAALGGGRFGVHAAENDDASVLLFLDDHHLASHRNLDIRIGEATLINEMLDTSCFVG